MELSIDSSSARLSARLGGMHAAIGPAVTRVFRTRVGPALQTHMMRLVSGDLLNVRSGAGRRSISWRLEGGGGDTVVLLVGSDLRKAPYMRIQDLGGTITPKRAQFLTIPIGEALTGQGVTRFSARDVISRPEAYGFTGTFFRNKILFGRREAGVTPLFVLKKSVQITGVRFRSKTISQRRGWIRTEVRRAIRTAMTEARA